MTEETIAGQPSALDHADVTINGHTYRFGRIPALTGIWCIEMMQSDSMNEPDIMRQLNAFMLATCSEIRADGTPVRLFEGGKFLNPKLGLDTDFDTVYAIVKEANKFNFGSYFKRLAEKQKGMNDTAPEETH